MPGVPPAAARERTAVGSYFVANYPPFSAWTAAALDDAHAALASPPADVPLGLYLHIPFCRKRCHFCYFRVYTDKNARQVEEYLARLVRTTPLDIMAGVMLDYFGELSGAATVLFGVYDEFLGMLHDGDLRKHLKELPAGEADTDAVYQRVRDLGQRFQGALTDVFFACDTPLRELTIRYGVF